MRILIVEDNDDVRRMLAAVLEAEGYEVTAAVSGRQALDYLLTRGPYRAVITDLALPGGTGNELLDAMRMEKMTTPVIVLSGMPDLPPQTPPVAACFRKPAEPAALLAKLRELGGQPRRRAEPAT